MAGCARLFPAYGHSRVVEQISSQFYLCFCHGIAGRDGWFGEAFGQVPVKGFGAGRATKAGKQEGGEEGT